MAGLFGDEGTLFSDPPIVLSDLGGYGEDYAFIPNTSDDTAAADLAGNPIFRQRVLSRIRDATVDTPGSGAVLQSSVDSILEGAQSIAKNIGLTLTPIAAVLLIIIVSLLLLKKEIL